jgi:hypothetical protein
MTPNRMVARFAVGLSRAREISIGGSPGPSQTAESSSESGTTLEAAAGGGGTVGACRPRVRIVARPPTRLGMRHTMVLSGPAAPRRHFFTPHIYTNAAPGLPKIHDSRSNGSATPHAREPWMPKGRPPARTHGICREKRGFLFDSDVVFSLRANAPGVLVDRVATERRSSCRNHRAVRLFRSIYIGVELAAPPSAPIDDSGAEPWTLLRANPRKPATAEPRSCPVRIVAMPPGRHDGIDPGGAAFSSSHPAVVPVRVDASRGSRVSRVGRTTAAEELSWFAHVRRSTSRESSTSWTASSTRASSIDAYVRVSLAGLELVGVDARVVVASVVTYRSTPTPTRSRRSRRGRSSAHARHGRGRSRQ